MRKLLNISALLTVCLLIGCMYIHCLNPELKEQKSTLQTSILEIGSGTGYFVNDDTLVTDGHVAIDGMTYTALDYKTNETSTLTLINKDAALDLAIFHVDHPFKNITPLCVTDKELHVGDNISMAGYGDPYDQGFNKDFHTGHISGLIQADLIGKPVTSPVYFVLGDIMAYPGDSGSPILAHNSCVIGNVHFGVAIEGRIISTLEGLTNDGSLVKFLEKNNINFHKHNFSILSDYTRLDNATVRISIMMPVIPPNTITEVPLVPPSSTNNTLPTSHLS